jgi:hypothetical protein
MSFINTHTEQLNDDISLHFLHIENLNDEIISLIDQTIISICLWPDYNTTIINQKIELKKLLENKSWTQLELWHISEFFIHLYLNYIGLKQECLYENLEETWIKKWFDGYYSDINTAWLVESKSWNICSQNISHKSKIDEAYVDLSHKVSWRNVRRNWTPISPWKNAYRHAKVSNARDSIIQRINILSEEFNSGMFHDISEFSIIPVSTIFFDWKISINNWVEDLNTVKAEILDRIIGKNIKQWHIICFSQSTKDLLLNYLRIC